LSHKYVELSALNNEDKGINLKAFQSWLELKSHGFDQHGFKAFDLDEMQKIELQKFLQEMSSTSIHASLEEKERFAFHFYDLNQNGFMERDEFSKLGHFIFVEHGHDDLPEEQKENAVDTPFSNLDMNEDGKMSFDEFFTALKSQADILNRVLSSISF
jgi:Ca2+-binding EF-hand superfamily protein